MKQLFNQRSQGYSWSNDHSYYLCESMEEYNGIVEKFKVHPSWMEVWKESQISCTPSTLCLDGYCVHGGHNLDAVGITIKEKSGTSSMDYSSYKHYIKPGTIKIDNEVPTEGWWAS